MLYLGRDDTQTMSHIDEVIGDRLSGDDTYEDEDRATADKIGAIKCPSLVIDGAEMTDAEATAFMSQIVLAELANWVPDASQRLLHRAGAALGIPLGNLLTSNPDCGASPGWHSLVADWAGGIFVRRCVTCGRLFRG